MGVYAGDTVPYLTETFNVAPSVQRYIGNALVVDNDAVRPTLDLDFANNKSLIDDVSGNNLITFTRESTATYVGADGLIKTANADEPRFDHDPITLECKGLLIEESRTNKLSNSDDFSGNWGINNSTITTDVTLSPDGISLADEVYATSSAVNTGLIRKTIGGFTQNVWHTFSVFWKAGTSYGFTAQLPWSDGANAGVAAAFILSNGQLISLGTAGYGNQELKGYTIEKYSNDWWRVSITYRATGVPTGSIFQAWLLPSFESNGTKTTNLTSYFWGAQVEIGEFVTSYIPTPPGSTATRSADSASITGTNFSSWYNQSEGTVFADAICNGFGGGGVVSFVGHIHDGSTNNYIDVLRYQPTARSIVNVGASPQSILSSSVALGSYHKSAQAYKLNDFSLSIDGASVLTDNLGTLPSPSILTLGNDSSNGRALNGYISRLAYYPTRLSNATLQEITADNPTNLPATITPSIVTDGLVLNLDAGTPSSYSGTGTTWFDKTDNSGNGTLTNGPTFSTDGQGSIVFDGSNDYVTGNTPSGLNLSQPCTVNIWVYFNNFTQINPRIIEIQDSSYSIQVLRAGASTRLATKNSSFQGGTDSTTWFVPSTNVWYNISVVWNPSTTSTILYLNSVLQSSVGSTPVGIGNQANKYVLGYRSDFEATTILNGKIAQVQIYNRALTQQEVRQNYQALLPRFAVTDGLVLNLDAGNRKSYPATGTTWTDLTGSGNNGTLTNGPTFNSSNGGSIVFDGSNDYVQINQTLSTPFSITGFVRYTDQSKVQNSFFNSSPHNTLLISLNRTGVGDLMVWIGNGSGWLAAPSITSSEIMNINQWYQVSFTTTGSGSTLYLNGVNVGTSVYSPSGWGSTYYLGTIIIASGEWMRGNIANTQIYNKALTQQEVRQNFEVNRGRFGI